MLNAPPITPVVTTDRVSRKTQEVSANQTKQLLRPVPRVLTSSWRNATGIGARFGRRPPPTSVVTVRRGPKTRPPTLGPAGRRP